VYSLAVSQKNPRRGQGVKECIVKLHGLPGIWGCPYPSKIVSETEKRVSAGQRCYEMKRCGQLVARGCFWGRRHAVFRSGPKNNVGEGLGGGEGRGKGRAPHVVQAASQRRKELRGPGAENKEHPKGG